eukprot:SAG11_NODE_10197_length_848_cov_0.801068_2_plen_21_part_01
MYFPNNAPDVENLFGAGSRYQ